MRISNSCLSLCVMVAAFAASACGASSTVGPDPMPVAGPTAGPSPAFSTDAFIRAIEEQGVRVVRIEEMPRQSYPFFSVAAQRLNVADENVYTFDYGRLEDADREAALISRDGSTVGNAHIDWIRPPRFYRKERLIVLYVGATPDVIRTLETILGPPIAAR